MRRLLLIALFMSMGICSAQPLTLEQCYSDSYLNHPGYDNLRLMLGIGQLDEKNAAVSRLPQATISANSSWQSDVTRVNIALPGIGELDIPELTRDWYKLYIDVTQNLYDGGISKSRIEAARSKTKIDIQQQEVNLYAVRGNVNLAYFSLLSLQKQIRILELKREVLDDQINNARSALRNGMLTESDLNNLEAEKILLKQQLIEAESLYYSAIDQLSIFTGKKYEKDVQVTDPPDPYLESSMNVNRPEINLFEYQKDQISVQDELLKKGRRPVIFGYGQAGYGRPGLNMFNNNFDDWYLVGIGMKWKITDWKETDRKRAGLVHQQDIIDNQKENFLYQLDQLITAKQNEMDKLNRILESDLELIKIRNSMVEKSSSKLRNGTLTAVDFLRDLNNSISAQIMFESHQVALLRAKYELLTLTGRTETK
jgi:outer membrane protein TolC